jgi:hypothetical protein
MRRTGIEYPTLNRQLKGQGCKNRGRVHEIRLCPRTRVKRHRIGFGHEGGLEEWPAFAEKTRIMHAEGSRTERAKDIAVPAHTQSLPENPVLPQLTLPRLFGILNAQ